MYSEPRQIDLEDAIRATYSGRNVLEETLAAGVAALEAGAAIPSLDLSPAEMAVRIIALEARCSALETEHSTRGHTCPDGIMGKRHRKRCRTLG
jgi:hypothetical protein